MNRPTQQRTPMKKYLEPLLPSEFEACKRVTIRKPTEWEQRSFAAGRDMAIAELPSYADAAHDALVARVAELEGVLRRCSDNLSTLNVNAEGDQKNGFTGATVEIARAALARGQS